MKLHGTRAYIEPTPVPKMPTGLVQLMEGLSREVLKNNPSQVYTFCAQHMRNLIALRDGKPPGKKLTLEQKINKANIIVKRRAEERRRNFDMNMRLHGDQDMKQSLGNDVEIASVGNAGSLNTSKDLKLSEWYEDDIEKDDSNVETGSDIKDNGQVTRDESVVNEDDKEITTNVHKNQRDNKNVPASDTPTDVQDLNIVNQESNNVGDDDKLTVEQASEDKIEKPISTNGEENDNRKNVIQELDINVESDMKPDLVTSNIKINEVSNVDIGELITESTHINEEIKGELKVKLNDDLLKASEQSDGGDNINDNIIAPVDSIKDSEPNIEAGNDEITDNIPVKYIDVEAKDNERNGGINVETKSATVVDNNIIVTKVDMTKEIVEDTKGVLQNQIDTVETDCQINNIKHDDENTTKTVKPEEVPQDEVIKENETIISGPPLDDKSNDNMIDVLLSEQHVDETDRSTNVTEIIKHTIKDDSEMNVLQNENESELIINVERKQQDGGNNAQVVIENSDDKSESNNINKLETNKLKTPKTMDLETAAITIQKVFRNFLFRSKTSSFEEPTNIQFNMFGQESDTKDQNDYSIHSQNKDRRVMGVSRMDTVLQTVNEEKSLSLSTDDSSTISSAATVIQAHVRGFLCRNRLNRKKITSSTSLNTSKDSSPVSSEADPDVIKNKTILNIHIVPEGSQFVRDESILTSMELSLDGSPPESALHPLGYNERRKQLKREDAIQSISPPSNNSRLSEEQDSVKEVVNEVEMDKKNNSERGSDQQELTKDVFIADDKIEEVNNVAVIGPPDSQINVTGSADSSLLKNDIIAKQSSKETLKNNNEQNEIIEGNKTEIKNNDDGVEYGNNAEKELVKESLVGNDEQIKSKQNIDLQLNISPHGIVVNNDEDKATTEISDELDVVTPFTNDNDSNKPKLLHSGEFHDVVLPTKVSRNDTSVASGE